MTEINEPGRYLPEAERGIGRRGRIASDTSNGTGRAKMTHRDGDLSVPVAFLGADYPGLRIRAEVAEGAMVRAGEIVFRDRKRPQIAFVSPIAGCVTAIRHGRRRVLDSFEVSPDASVAPSTKPTGTPDPEAVRAILLEQGLWTAFVARPFGGLPDPDATPDAIFITATRASETAPDPAEVLHESGTDFREGAALLTRLTKSHVHLCQEQGPDLITELPDGVRITKFPRGPGSGLSGTHIHRLYPVSYDRQVWSIGYQDVAAIGALFRTGHAPMTRLVAVHGSRVVEPRLLRLPLGADLRSVALEAGDGRDPAPRLMSGPPRTGREAAFLGRHHDEIVFDTAPVPRRSRNTRGPRPVLPLAGLERALALDILPVPLMRALSTGDAETAERLGCLELLEDDVAELTVRCASGTDYGRRLRSVLDNLRERAL